MLEDHPLAGLAAQEEMLVPEVLEAQAVRAVHLLEVRFVLVLSLETSSADAPASRRLRSGTHPGYSSYSPDRLLSAPTL